MMYNEYFGFSVSPFSTTPDPTFFYTTPVYREAFAILQYGIEGKKGFIVVTGEVGTGKTTLLRRLMTHNFKGTIRTVFLFNTNLNFLELLQMLVCDLGLTITESNNKAVLLQELNNYLLTQLEQGNIVAVLVDEAQNLSDEALEGLRLLSNMETDREKLIQIVLIGQPELEATLDRPTLRQFKQRVALHCRISPLKREEISPYIDFRIRTAGYNAGDLFEPDALELVTLYSKGIPRLVNIICDNALLSAFAQNQRTISDYIIKDVARDLRLGNEIKENSELAPCPFDRIGEPEPIIPTGQQQKVISSAEPKYSFANPTLEEVVANVFEVNRCNDKDERADRITRKPPQSFQQPLQRASKVAFPVLLMLFGIFAIASIMEPKDFLVYAGKTLGFAKHNWHQWVLFVTKQEPLPRQAAAVEEVSFKPNEQRITIPRGSSVYQLAGKAYGANSSLGVDLIREFNPDIKDISKITAGQSLILPGLSLETLLRRQVDGSYHLIVATFRQQFTAEQYATRLREKGFSARITPRRIADDVWLHRVEIDGLKIFEEANQAWLTALRNEWLVLSDNKVNAVATAN